VSVWAAVIVYFSGAAAGWLACFYFLARPMARLLGFEPSASSVPDETP
jgi:hypothetical protein